MSLRLRLKEATRELHDRVESTTSMKRLLEDGLTREEYADALATMLAFYETVESRLRTVEGLRDAVIDFDRRMKCESLRADLLGLGRAPAAPSADFPIHNLSEAMGVMYVLEGSSLGGRVIAGRLSNLDFVSSDTLNFFGHYGDELGAYWQRFVALLDSMPLDEEAALSGATRTFEALENALELKRNEP